MVFHSPPKTGGETESMTSLSLGITDRSSVMDITNSSSGTKKDMDNSCIEATEWPLNGAKEIGEILHLSPVELAQWNSILTHNNKEECREMLKEVVNDLKGIPDK